MRIIYLFSIPINLTSFEIMNVFMNFDFRSGRKPVPNPSVLSRPTLDDSIVLVNGDNGAFLALNNSGKVIWNLIDGKLTEAEIIACVCKDFQNVPDTVTDDVTSLIATLSEEGFIGYEMIID